MYYRTKTSTDHLTQHHHSLHPSPYPSLLRLIILSWSPDQFRTNDSDTTALWQPNKSSLGLSCTWEREMVAVTQQEKYREREEGGVEGGVASYSGFFLLHGWKKSLHGEHYLRMHQIFNSNIIHTGRRWMRCMWRTILNQTYEASIMASWLIGHRLTRPSYAFARQQRVTYTHIANVNNSSWSRWNSGTIWCMRRQYLPSSFLIYTKKRAGVQG